VLGSLILGGILAADHAGALPGGWVVALLGTGFCGAFTTFSTFAYETMRLVEGGSAPMALGNVAASLAAGMVAAMVGWSATLAILGGSLA
jgi:CrcB protein